MLVLSLFPGIGLLDRAFEEVGFCVVRGPDVLWGGDVKRFRPPAGRFDGIIGGPPCKAFSKMRHILLASGISLAENLIPEFERCAGEAQPQWFLMENVPDAPIPVVAGYVVHRITINNRWLKADPDGLVGPEQNRERCFSFGTREGLRLNVADSVALMENPHWSRAVVAGSAKEGAIARSQDELAGTITPRLRRQAAPLPGQKPRRTVERCAELQGLPADFLEDAPFTVEGKYTVIGNGVPLPMGRAIAKAIKEAMGYQP
jgi:DNA (cytosine-5)-methyltransferase 1